MKQVSFTVDEKPVGQNQVYRRSSNGRMFMTDEGKQYKELLGWAAAQAMGSNPFFTRPKVTLTFFFGDKRRRDIDGAIKLTIDAFNKICWEDDSCIRELHVYKEEGAARVKVNIIEY